jgi:uncharacterized circularly permuted ATP-grasp superfamily protein/uncharacterized alpha-E superfamily protein
MPGTLRSLRSPRQKAQRLASLLEGYAPLPGGIDECVEEEGILRRHWQPLFDSLADHTPDELERRFTAARRYIAEAGVSYRVYGDDGGERSWPLSPIPLVLSPADWAQIETGVVQRARLMEAILEDFYGANALVRAGALPAALVAGSAEFLRPLVGVAPPGGSFLNLFAVDLGRGPDGQWWVLSDRAQAPSGAGYALENRIALSRALTDTFGQLNVRRLAGFFSDFRSSLAHSATRADPRICLLTPGPLSETYYEHALLARYLGFLLIEGSDLSVRDGKVFVRTIAGLKRADVLWRRIDADFADPLELNTASQLGVPGLVEAIRQDQVVVANALGSGVVEARALLGFLPALARHVLGEELTLPHIATWWCGQPDARAHAIANLDSMAFASAFGADVPELPDAQGTPGHMLDAGQRRSLLDVLERRPVDVVAQEMVRLSTLPVWEGGRLVPRPFTLRVYATRTPRGWEVMPGGFCRISSQADTRAISMRAGALSTDVWVTSDHPVVEASLLPDPSRTHIRRTLTNIPSRAADNLFWLGRYLERTEATLRLSRAWLNRRADEGVDDGATAGARRRMEQLLAIWQAVPAGKPVTAADLLFQSEALLGAPARLASETLRTASAVRERLSGEAWRTVSDLHILLTAKPQRAMIASEVQLRMEQALGRVAGFNGLIHENMIRGAGWRFLQLGRRLERGVLTCRMARQFADPHAPPDSLDVLLELADAQITYRSRYMMAASRIPVLDIVVLDGSNPRSVAFQVGQVERHLGALPALRDDGVLDAPRRLAVALDALLQTTDAQALDLARLVAIEAQLMELSNAITDRFFQALRDAAPKPKTALLA